MVTCKCGKMVPDEGKREWCSKECYNRDYYRRNTEKCMVLIQKSSDGKAAAEILAGMLEDLQVGERRGKRKRAG